MPMTEDEYEAFVESVYKGRVLVGVDRVYARKLYTDVSISAIQEATGEPPHFEKLVAWSAFILSPIAAVGSFVLAGFAFRWWSLLVIPIAFLFWLLNKSMSVRPRSSVWLLTLLVVAAIVVHMLGLSPTPWVSAFGVTFLLALWSDRLLYWVSTTFLRAFVLRNQRAFVAFQEGITIRDAR